MKILLIGEYSRLHNSLKEGLEKLGHEILLVGECNDYKKYPIDININNRIFKNPFLIFLNKGFYKLFKIDLRAIERGLWFGFYMRKFNNYDVVQLVHESAIRTVPFLEIFFLKKIIGANRKLFLLSCTSDSKNIKYALDGKFKYSIISPFLKNYKKEFKTYFRFFTKKYSKLSVFLDDNVRAIIASDIDYHLPLQYTRKYCGLIPNPINIDKIDFIPLKIDSKIKIFHGINTYASNRKGNSFFIQAIEIIIKKYPKYVEVTTIENMVYENYINIYNECHILLDQVYSYDQGYNALEAMAKGKVVFTGAEQEFLEYYGLKKNEICINALPNVESIVEELEYLILNPSKIEEISKNARKFIEEKHNYIKIAEKYLEVWNAN